MNKSIAKTLIEVFVICSIAPVATVAVPNFLGFLIIFLATWRFDLVFKT